MKSNLTCHLVLLSGLFIVHSQATAVTLVEKGQARAVIIVPERTTPLVENAARVLRDHIKQMSGAELPIRTEDKITGSPSPDQAWILVGESLSRIVIDSLPADLYSIRVHKGETCGNPNNLYPSPRESRQALR